MALPRMLAPLAEVLAARGPQGRVLHATWFAFFLVFLLWFGHAPLLPAIRAELGLSDAQVAGLMVLNVALTPFARVLVGMLTDRLGPRRTYALVLVTGGLLTVAFALARDFTILASLRLASGVIGAGFVVGIRMIGEWFPRERLGVAEGIYGGFGNAGSAAGALILPGLALLAAGGGLAGWRIALAAAGLVAMAYGLLYLWLVRDAPRPGGFRAARRATVLGVRDATDLRLYTLLLLGLYAALGLVTWRLTTLGLLSPTAAIPLLLLLALLWILDVARIRRAQRPAPGRPAPEPVDMRTVALLALSYAVCFGSELALVSFLPTRFAEMFELSPVAAGVLAAAFALANPLGRPLGGLFADLGDRRTALTLMLLGIAAGYVLLARLDPSWPPVVAWLLVFGCALWVMAAEGAVFAWVPRLHPRATGRIAGLVGAYGNIGAVVFLGLYPLLGMADLLLVIALLAAALVAVLVGGRAATPAPAPAGR